MSSVETDLFEPAITTMEQSGLDPALCIIHGGAVMARHQLRPIGSDLDVLLHPRYYDQRAEEQRTPTGLVLAETDTIKGRRRMTSVGSLEEGLLAIDASTFLGRFKTLRFLGHLFTAEKFVTRIGVLNVASLGLIFNQKSRRECARDRQDVSLINSYYDRAINETVK